MDPEDVAFESPYAAFRNNPIIFNDPKGDFPGGGDGGGKGAGSRIPGSGGFSPGPYTPYINMYEYQWNSFNDIGNNFNGFLFNIGALTYNASSGIINIGGILTSNTYNYGAKSTLNLCANAAKGAFGGFKTYVREAAIYHYRTSWDKQLQAAGNSFLNLKNYEGAVAGIMMGGIGPGMTREGIGGFFSRNLTKLKVKPTITIYRGVNSEAGGATYTNAINGIVKPRGHWLFGHSKALKHNTGINGTVNSKFTSWTTDIDVALNYAYRTNGQGVIMEMQVPRSILFKSPNLKLVNLFHKPGVIVSESEWLLKGTYKNVKFKKVEF